MEINKRRFFNGALLAITSFLTLHSFGPDLPPLVIATATSHLPQIVPAKSRILQRLNIEGPICRHILPRQLIRDFYLRLRPLSCPIALRLTLFHTSTGDALVTSFRQTRRQTRPESTLSPCRMVQWLRALPSRRLALSFVAPARLPPVRHVSYRLFPHPRPRFFRRPVFWLLPVAGGISLYFYPRPQLISSQLLSSPTLIPCPPHESPTSHETLILSPSEHGLSPSERIRTFLIEHIWEPILTARRFVHLFFLLFPVILSSPMLLVGSPEERLQGDRWGAVWWYDYLVVQMDRAGPTFTKVSNIVLLFGIQLTSACSLLSGQPRVQICFPLCCVNVWARCILKEEHTLLHIQSVS